MARARRGKGKGNSRAPDFLYSPSLSSVCHAGYLVYGRVPKYCIEECMLFNKFIKFFPAMGYLYPTDFGSYLGDSLRVVSNFDDLRVVSNSDDSGEIHASARNWAWCLPSRRVSTLEPIFARAWISPKLPKLETTRKI